MATQFEFRLIDGKAPAGELEADQLIAIAQSLKEIATKISRQATEAEPVGRPSQRTQHVARLTIGLAPGSTCVRVRRTADEDALEFDLNDERTFDEEFESLVGAIAKDERPAGTSDSIAAAAGRLRTALEDAAPSVEFRASGRVRYTFQTAETHQQTWVVDAAPSEEPEITFVGQLRAVNLDTHRLQVTDDVGTKVALPGTLNDADVGRLLGQYVKVAGVPERDLRGRLTHIHDAVVEAAEPLPDGIGHGVRPAVSLEDVMASAPGPHPGGIPGLTDEEADAFLQVIGR